MSPPGARGELRSSALRLACAAALVALLAGCGATKTTGPSGESGGNDLVVYATDRFGSPGDFDIVLYDLDQLGFRSLAGLNNTAPDVAPCLTSDAQYVAFASTRAAGAGGSDLYLFDRINARLVAQPGLNTSADETQPCFTFDAQKLAFVRDSLGSNRIRLYDPLGDSLIVLPGIDAPGAGNDVAPSPNQTGSLIAFESDRGGSRHVYVWDRALGAVRNLPDLVADSSDIEPSITPDGHYLAFASNRSTAPASTGGYDIYVYDLVANTFVTLTGCNSVSHDRHPSLSRDGTRLIFESDRALGLGKWDLYNYNRTAGTIGVGTQQNSADDERMPYLLWK